MGEQQIFNLLIEFFEEDEWDFQWTAGTPILSMGFQGMNGSWLCYAQAREPEEQVIFYSDLAINVPPDKRLKIAEFITRVNYGMVIGNFEMDFEDGEVRYKTSLDIEGAELTAAMIRQLVYANLVITDRYLPGIMQVMYSNISPEAALDNIELIQDYEDIFDNNAFLDNDDDNNSEDFNNDDDDDFDASPPYFDDMPPMDGGTPN